MLARLDLMGASEGLGDIPRSVNGLKPCGTDFDQWEAGYGRETANKFFFLHSHWTVSSTKRFHTVSEEVLQG